VFAFGFGARQVDNDFDLGLARQFARPADDEILGLAVEVALAERERVERVEKLGQLLHLDFDGWGGGFGHVSHSSNILSSPGPGGLIPVKAAPVPWIRDGS
jgi:hypothetical protein